MNWRQIEAALQDYFGGACDEGDYYANVEAAGIFDDICDDCPANNAAAELINLTELAKHIADYIEGGK
jgi:hypothetical protein